MKQICIIDLFDGIIEHTSINSKLYRDFQYFFQTSCIVIMFCKTTQNVFWGPGSLFISCYGVRTLPWWLSEAQFPRVNSLQSANSTASTQEENNIVNSRYRRYCLRKGSQRNYMTWVQISNSAAAVDERFSWSNVSTNNVSKAHFKYMFNKQLWLIKVYFLYQTYKII